MRSAFAAIPTLLLWVAAPAAAQAQDGASGSRAERPDAREGVLWLLHSRVGFMVTGGDGFDDRAFVQLDGGAQFGRASVGAGPAIGLTLGTAVGASHFLGGTNVSLRVLGGVELPWALDVTAFGDGPVELVPALQAGYLKAYDEDERSGFTLRATVGLRLLPGSSPFFFTFEPITFVLLPSPDPSKAQDRSRLAVELGLLKVGWRF